MEGDNQNPRHETATNTEKYAPRPLPVPHVFSSMDSIDHLLKLLPTEIDDDDWREVDNCFAEGKSSLPKRGITLEDTSQSAGEGSSASHSRAVDHSAGTSASGKTLIPQSPRIQIHPRPLSTSNTTSLAPLAPMRFAYPEPTASPLCVSREFDELLSSTSLGIPSGPGFHEDTMLDAHVYVPLDSVTHSYSPLLLEDIVGRSPSTPPPTKGSAADSCSPLSLEEVTERNLSPPTRKLSRECCPRRAQLRREVAVSEPPIEVKLEPADDSPLSSPDSNVSLAHFYLLSAQDSDDGKGPGRQTDPLSPPVKTPPRGEMYRDPEDLMVEPVDESPLSSPDSDVSPGHFDRPSLQDSDDGRAPVRQTDELSPLMTTPPRAVVSSRAPGKYAAGSSGARKYIPDHATREAHSSADWPTTDKMARGLRASRRVRSRNEATYERALTPAMSIKEAREDRPEYMRAGPVGPSRKRRRAQRESSTDTKEPQRDSAEEHFKEDSPGYMRRKKRRRVQTESNTDGKKRRRAQSDSDKEDAHDFKEDSPDYMHQTTGKKRRRVQKESKADGKKRRRVREKSESDSQERERGKLQRAAPARKKRKVGSSDDEDYKVSDDEDYKPGRATTTKPRARKVPNRRTVRSTAPVASSGARRSLNTVARPRVCTYVHPVLGRCTERFDNAKAGMRRRHWATVHRNREIGVGGPVTDIVHKLKADHEADPLHLRPPQELAEYLAQFDPCLELATLRHVELFFQDYQIWKCTVKKCEKLKPLGRLSSFKRHMRNEHSMKERELETLVKERTEFKIS